MNIKLGHMYIGIRDQGGTNWRGDPIPSEYVPFIHAEILGEPSPYPFVGNLKRINDTWEVDPTPPKFIKETPILGIPLSQIRDKLNLYLQSVTSQIDNMLTHATLIHSLHLVYHI